MIDKSAPWRPPIRIEAALPFRPNYVTSVSKKTRWQRAELAASKRLFTKQWVMSQWIRALLLYSLWLHHVKRGIGHV